MARASSYPNTIVAVPVVPLWPIMGPLGVLPELCEMIEHKAMYISVVRLYKEMQTYACYLYYRTLVISWDERMKQAVFWDEKTSRPWVNCQVLMSPRHGITCLLRTIGRVREIEFGVNIIRSSKTSDDWYTDVDLPATRPNTDEYTMGNRCGVVMCRAIGY